MTYVRHLRPITRTHDRTRTSLSPMSGWDLPAAASDERVCPQCATAFTPRRGARITCSDECRKIYIADAAEIDDPVAMGRYAHG